MHHSVSLTTSFVKNFFPNNSLTQSSSSVEPQQEQQQLPQQEYAQLQEEPTTTMNQSSTITESVTTQVSSPINRSVEESAPVATQAVESSPKAVEVEKKAISAEEYNLAKFKYEQLKNQQNRLLEHLQDARVEHLEEEISKLDKLIPHHRTIQSYGCSTQRSDLINCFKANNTPYGTLNCSHLVKEFTKCAQQKRREFLGNPDL